MSNGHEPGIGPRHFFGAVPVFLIDDVASAAEYYRDVDFPEYARVTRDEAIIDFLASDPPGRRNSIASAGVSHGAKAVLVVNDVEDVYIEIQERGASVLERLAVREYRHAGLHP